MTPREIARLCFKVLAIYTIVGAISQFGQFAAFAQVGWQSSSSLVGSLSALLVASAPIIQFVIGMWLWHKAAVVAAWATGHDLQDEPQEPDDPEGSIAAGGGLAPETIHAIVLSSLGVWVLIDVVPTLVATIASALLTADWAGLTPGMREQVHGMSLRSVLSLLARLLIGIWLVFGNAGLVALLGKARSIGLDEGPTR